MLQRNLLYKNRRQAELARKPLFADPVLDHRTIYIYFFAFLVIIWISLLYVNLSLVNVHCLWETVPPSMCWQIQDSECVRPRVRSSSTVDSHARCYLIKRHGNSVLIFPPKWIRSHDTILFIYFIFFFWPHHAACGILVPWPGIKPMPPAVEVRSLNHWTTWEVPLMIQFYISGFLFLFFLHSVGPQRSTRLVL